MRNADGVGLGALAGLAGTAVMIAMRTFDEQYAPATLLPTKEDPGAFLMHRAKRIAHLSGELPSAVEQTVDQTVEETAALAAHAGYGTLYGILYGLWRGRGRRRSALADGVMLGTTVYAASDLGLLPATDLSKPPWKQKLPQIAGELLRHIAYGVAVASAYGILDERL
jgi:uncharacterized membrane protein YagU involved in acid resistance